MKLLGTLDGALSKRNSDAHDAAALLQASTEMFSEADAALAKVINVEPLPKASGRAGARREAAGRDKGFCSRTGRGEEGGAGRYVTAPVLGIRRAAGALNDARCRAPPVFNQDRDAWAIPYMSGESAEHRRGPAGRLRR